MMPFSFWSDEEKKTFADEVKEFIANASSDQLISIATMGMYWTMDSIRYFFLRARVTDNQILLKKLVAATHIIQKRGSHGKDHR